MFFSAGLMATLLFLSSSSALSVTQSSRAPITAGVAGDVVRFLSPGETCQIRVEIVAASGMSLFDSDWKEGNVFDWKIDPILADGTYRATVTVRDLEGRLTGKEMSFELRNGEPRIEREATGKATLLTHDGENGSVITTSGDLAFRFGDLLAGKEKEGMRLTRDGSLHVHGVIQAEGIEFPDGTILRGPADAGSVRAATAADDGKRRAAVLQLPRIAATPPHQPRPNFTPAYQFVVNDSGVTVGTTNPAYKLDVAGPINTSTRYDIGGNPFAHTYGGLLNLFLGIGAGNLNLSGGSNTGIGDGALNSSTSGYSNTAVGAFTLNANTIGYENVAVGYGALQNSNARYNTAVGTNALQNLGGYNSNTAIGWGAMSGASTAAFNVAVGTAALPNNSSGQNNVAVGMDTLQIASGNDNIAIGRLAGSSITTGSSNIDLGNSGSAPDTFTIRIGSGQSRTFIAGIRGITTGSADAVNVVIDSNGQLGTVSSSRRFKFDISDIGRRSDDLLRLRPVTFRYRAHGENAPLQYGLIAEEVAEVYPELVTRDAGGQPEAVMYQFLAPMLLNEVQKQKQTIDALERRLAVLEEQLAKLVR